MNQKRVGTFLKELRNGKGLTQEQLAEKMAVSGRTVSRWETGANMPDLDLLIELADYYNVEIGEILNGETKGEKMDQELKDTVRKVADYSNEEKARPLRNIHALFILGVVAFIAYVVLDVMVLADSGMTGNIADFALGLDFGIMILGVIYTSRSLSKIHALKMRLVNPK